MKKLRFVARGSALVPNIQLQEGGTRAFVGRKWTEIKTSDPAASVLAAEGLMDLNGPSRWTWVSTNEPEEVSYHRDYVKACADGHLWPADEETAFVCNEYARANDLPEVKFDPKFGEGARNALVRTGNADQEG